MIMKRITLLTTSMLLFAVCAMAQQAPPAGGPPAGAPGAGGPPGGGRGPQGPPPPPPRYAIVHDAEVASKQVTYTIEVLNIISTKCIGCHSPTSRNNNAKRDLLWEKLQDTSGADAKLLLDSIKYDVTEKKMPPARAVERNPALALTQEEADKLKAWVDETLAKVK
jgi:hypothetical protein